MAERAAILHVARSFAWSVVESPTPGARHQWDFFWGWEAGSSGACVCVCVCVFTVVGSPSLASIAAVFSDTTQKVYGNAA